MDRKAGVLRSPTNLRKPGSFSAMIHSSAPRSALSSGDGITGYAVLHPGEKCSPRIAVTSASPRSRDPIGKVSALDLPAKKIKVARAPQDPDVQSQRQLLEAKLIDRAKVLNKLAAEAEKSNKLYTSTREQLMLKQQANREQADKVISSVQSVRKSLQIIDLTT